MRDQQQQQEEVQQRQREKASFFAKQGRKAQQKPLGRLLLGALLVWVPRTLVFAAQSDQIQLQALGGSNQVVMQSFTVLRHFSFKAKGQASLDLSGMPADESSDESETTRSPLSWMVGMAYTGSRSSQWGSYAASPLPNAVLDNTFSGATGLLLEVGQAFHVGALIGLDYGYNESYTHGKGLLELGYTWSFHRLEHPGEASEPEKDPTDLAGSDYDAHDAVQFYHQDYLERMKKLQRELGQARLKLAENAADESSTESSAAPPHQLSAKEIAAATDLDNPDAPKIAPPAAPYLLITADGKGDLFPALSINYRLAIHGHKTDLKFFRNPVTDPASYYRTLDGIYNTQSLVQFSQELELSYAPSSVFGLALLASLTSATINLDVFLAGIESSQGSRLPLTYAGSGFLGQFNNSFLSFPSSSFTLTGTWKVSEQNQLALVLNETNYQATGISPTAAVNPIFTHSFSPSWVLDVNANAVMSLSGVLSNVSGGIVLRRML